MKIQSATALVTGANRGIGYDAFVNVLLQAGVKKVYATAHDVSSLERVRALDTNRVIPLEVDITDRDLVNALPAQATDINF